ncbi:DUF3570 domain-containing protein [Flavobacterium sp.]|uniref:DUF3570 domain-containing protein n=1 Tax=Flavobacterium sp. TaxID=239 RepID=UPI0037A40B5A
MNKIAITLLFLITSVFSFSQVKDSTGVFKKRVLENSEIDFLSSYYNQDGNHAAVSGGLGTEKLSDFASNIIVAVPLNDDDVLTFDVGLSAYTSASSSNVNPFKGGSSSYTTSSGASGHQTTTTTTVPGTPPYGTPWQASSGASKGGTLAAINANYAHSSDDRNFIWNADMSLSSEFNYSSFGIGGGVTKLFNNKNTEISVKSNLYLDNWKIIYPTELKEYNLYGNDFQLYSYFSGVSILDKNGNTTTAYLPSTFKPWTSTSRNSYSGSLSLSQILTKKSQISIFMDILQQQGQLSTPYQRVYFADTQHYFIGIAQYIPVYQTSANAGVYQLADDIERMPSSRLKVPIGLRWSYYISEKITLRTYYRYYWDDWGVKGHTANIELPVKISERFTVYPMYRYYIQTAAKYFAPFEKHLSTEQYYTSDYDLSAFNAKQYGFGVNYTDIFANGKFLGLGIKNVDFRFNHYVRSDGLSANIGTIGIHFTTD